MGKCFIESILSRQLNDEQYISFYFCLCGDYVLLNDFVGSSENLDFDRKIDEHFLKLKNFYEVLN